MNANTETPTNVDLVRSSGAELVQLVRSELALARNELRDDVREVAGSAAVAGTSLLLGVAGAELVLGAVVVAARKHPFALALLGAGLLGAAVTMGGTAVATMRPVLQRTRHRVAEDAARLEESLR
jgi:uncharacterized membrane protein YqjE